MSARALQEATVTLSWVVSTFPYKIMKIKWFIPTEEIQYHFYLDTASNKRVLLIYTQEDEANRFSWIIYTYTHTHIYTKERDYRYSLCNSPKEHKSYDKPSFTPTSNNRQNYSFVYLNIYIFITNLKTKDSGLNGVRNFLNWISFEFLHVCNFYLCYSKTFNVCHIFKDLLPMLRCHFILSSVHKIQPYT